MTETGKDLVRASCAATRLQFISPMVLIQAKHNVFAAQAEPPAATPRWCLAASHPVQLSNDVSDSRSRKGSPSLQNRGAGKAITIQSLSQNAVRPVRTPWVLPPLLKWIVAVRNVFPAVDALRVIRFGILARV
jgi:hypothetical protein